MADGFCTFCLTKAFGGVRVVTLKYHVHCIFNCKGKIICINKINK